MLSQVLASLGLLAMVLAACVGTPASDPGAYEVVGLIADRSGPSPLTGTTD